MSSFTQLCSDASIKVNFVQFTALCVIISVFYPLTTLKICNKLKFTNVKFARNSKIQIDLRQNTIENVLFEY